MNLFNAYNFKKNPIRDYTIQQNLTVVRNTLYQNTTWTESFKWFLKRKLFFKATTM